MRKSSGLWIAVFFWIGGLGVAFAQTLSMDAQAIVERVRSAIEAEEARQAALPAAATDSVILERLGLLDQAGRGQLDMRAIQALPAEERREARSAAYRIIEQRDRANQDILRTLDPMGGWWGADRYGPEAAAAAFLVVQHASVDWWRRYLPALKAETEAGRIPGEEYALMADRLALVEQRPQPYGTQVVCEQNRFIIYLVEDREAVDRRRAALGMPGLADFERSIDAWPSC